MTKLLATGKTDLLDKFVSMRTRRAFKAFLAWDKEAGKVNFEFTPSKFPRKERPPSRRSGRGAAAASGGRRGAKRGTARRPPRRRRDARRIATRPRRRASPGLA